MSVSSTSNRQIVLGIGLSRSGGKRAAATDIVCEALWIDGRETREVKVCLETENSRTEAGKGYRSRGRYATGYRQTDGRQKRGSQKRGRDLLLSVPRPRLVGGLSSKLRAH